MLEALGWNSYFDAVWREREEANSVAGRVIAQHRGLWRVAIESREVEAEISGKMRYEAAESSSWPTVGDWVVMDGDVRGHLRIDTVLPRRTAIVRKSAGRKVEQQVLAANVDIAWLVMGLDGDYNLRRLERYLTMVWDGGVRPVVILNKRDLCGEIHSRVAEAEKASLGAPVFAISAVTGEGLSPVLQTVPSGATLVLIGSSGTGKSTLTNRLMQSELQATQTVRVGDSRGRHTTSSRQLFVLPGGAMLIDTPGLRELQLWETSGGLQRAFADIEELARRCRFDDCSHHAEPGCAVELAVASGELPAERLENYRKLNREREFLDRKVNPEARARERKMLKRVGREVRRLYERREREGK